MPQLCNDAECAFVDQLHIVDLARPLLKALLIDPYRSSSEPTGSAAPSKMAKRSIQISWYDEVGIIT